MALVEQAGTVCIDSQIVQARGRLLRENRRFSRDPLSLPPLDYWLPPLEGGMALPEVMSWPDERRLAPASTTLYVWGYTPPLGLLCREQGEATAAAAEFARESGWEASRDGAWAKAITAPGGLQEVLREMEPLLRQDPAVVGWGARMQRRRSGEDPE